MIYESMEAAYFDTVTSTLQLQDFKQTLTNNRLQSWWPQWRQQSWRVMSYVTWCEPANTPVLCSSAWSRTRDHRRTCHWLWCF